MNWSLPINYAYELLQSPAFPSKLGSSVILGSSGILTGLAQSIPSFCKMDLRYCLYEIIIDWLPSAILILTIFIGLPRLVSSHLTLRFAFVYSISSSVVVNSNKSSTQMVTMTNLSSLCRMYVHGSDINAQNSCYWIASSNSMFQTCLACFKLYMLLMSKHMSPLSSLKPIGCFM